MNERTYKRGQLEESQDNHKEISTKARLNIRNMRHIFDDENALEFISLDEATVLLDEIKKLQPRHKELSREISALRRELDLD